MLPHGQPVFPVLEIPFSNNGIFSGTDCDGADILGDIFAHFSVSAGRPLTKTPSW